jgi:hypothetical protein
VRSGRATGDCDFACSNRETKEDSPRGALAKAHACVDGDVDLGLIRKQEDLGQCQDPLLMQL